MVCISMCSVIACSTLSSIEIILLSPASLTARLKLDIYEMVPTRKLGISRLHLSVTWNIVITSSVRHNFVWKYLCCAKFPPSSWTIVGPTPRTSRLAIDLLCMEARSEASKIIWETQVSTSGSPSRRVLQVVELAGNHRRPWTPFLAKYRNELCSRPHFGHKATYHDPDN